MATHSEFARFEDRVEDTMEARFHRFEAKIDNITTAVARLMLFEERQANQQQRFQELASAVSAQRDQFDHRITSLATRFDERVSKNELAHLELRRELHGYVQRWLGVAAAITVVAGSSFAAFLRLIT